MAGLWDQIGNWWGQNFAPLDDKKRREVLNPGNGMPAYDRSKLGPTYTTQHPTDRRAVADSTPNRPAFTGWPAASYAITPDYHPGGGSVDDMRDRAMAGRSATGIGPQVTDDDRRASQQWQDRQRNSALLDELLGQMQDHFGGLDESRVNYGPLDAALKSRMDNLNSIRGQTNQNYDKSDLALEQMHRAVQNEMLTKGKAAYQDIGNDEQAALAQSNKDTVAGLQAIKAEDSKRRAALLANTGGGVMTAAPDPNDAILNEAIAKNATLNNADVAYSNSKEANNLAFNQGVASSVGQQGVERRSDLTQQLGEIMGRLGTVEAGYNNDYANQKLALQQHAEDQQYQEWRDRQGIIGNTVGQMEQDARERDKMAQDERIAMIKAAGSGSTQMPGGMNGFIADLGQNFSPEEVSKGIAALSGVLGTDYMSGINPNAGYTRTDGILRALQDPKWGLSPQEALYIAQNLGNQGTIK